MPTTTTVYDIVKPTSGAEPADMYGVATRLADSVEAALVGMAAITFTAATRTQSIANNTSVTLTAFDSFTGSGTGGTTEFWSYAAGTFTILEDGLYRLKGYADWSSNATGYRLCNFGTAFSTVQAANGRQTGQNGDATVALTAGATLSTVVRQTSGGALNADQITVSIQRLGTLAP